ncbi:hypothetical protein [Demequina salsinemoris]|nr:hypothetical protein [Demequina salsinemoris]
MCPHSTLVAPPIPAGEHPIRERLTLREETCCWRAWAYSDTPDDEPRPGS